MNLKFLFETEPLSQGRFEAFIQTPASGPLVLNAGRAVWWEAEKALMVADVHFGKANSFRRLGVPVPAGTTQQNFEKLNHLIQRYPVQTLYVLGDWLHNEPGADSDLPVRIKAWRDSHPKLSIRLIEGNHDLKARRSLALTGVESLPEPFCIQGLALCHHPQKVDGHFTIYGHEHPVIRLQGKGRQSARLPCFHLIESSLVLPAFGAFTGGHPVKPGSEDWIYPICPN